MGLFTHITRALNIDDTDPEERKVIQATIPDFVVDLRALPECAQDIATGNLTGGRHLADLETSAREPGRSPPGGSRPGVPPARRGARLQALHTRRRREGP